MQNGRLVKIDGIPLFTTYTEQKTKAALIEQVIKKLQTNNPSQSMLANSMSNILSSQTPDTLNIQYVHCENEIKNPVLKEEDLDEINQKVVNKAEELFVDTILWKKQEQSLSDVLNQKPVTEKIPIALFK